MEFLPKRTNERHTQPSSLSVYSFFFLFDIISISLVLPFFSSATFLRACCCLHFCQFSLLLSFAPNISTYPSSVNVVIMRVLAPALRHSQWTEIEKVKVFFFLCCSFFCVVRLCRRSKEFSRRQLWYYSCFGFGRTLLAFWVNSKTNKRRIRKSFTIPFFSWSFLFFSSSSFIQENDNENILVLVSGVRACVWCHLAPDSRIVYGILSLSRNSMLCHSLHQSSANSIRLSWRDRQFASRTKPHWKKKGKPRNVRIHTALFPPQNYCTPTRAYNSHTHARTVDWLSVL